MEDILNEKFKNVSISNLSHIHLCKSDLEKVLEGLKTNRNIQSIEWGDENQLVLSENRDLKINIYNQLIDNMFWKSPSVIDLSKFEHVNNDFLECLEAKVNHNSLIGDIIWPSSSNDDNQREIRDRIEAKLIENNANFRKFPSDYVHLLLACHCRSSPNDDSLLKEATGWQIDETFRNERISSSKGFIKQMVPKTKNCDAILYKNEATRHYVLAFRGLDVDLFVELFRDNKNPFKDQHSLADVSQDVERQTSFAYSVAKQVSELSRRQMFTLSFTGYALGAWLAEQSVYFYINEYQCLDVRAVTFDSPGLLEIYDKDSLMRAADIKTYLLCPHFVNTCNRHLGKVYHIYEDSSRGDPHIEKFISNLVVKEATKNWYEKKIKPELFKYKFYLNGLRALFEDADLKWLINEFKNSDFKEVLQWPKLDLSVKSTEYANFELKETIIHEVRIFIRHYLSSLALIGRILVRIRDGKVRDEHCLEGFRYDPLLDIFLHEERVDMLIVEKADYEIVYRDVYRVVSVDPKVDYTFHFNVPAHVDGHIWNFYTGRDDTARASGPLAQQFEQLKKLFTIETNNVESQKYVIQSKEIEIERVRDRFVRLFDLWKIYKKKLVNFN